MKSKIKIILPTILISLATFVLLKFRDKIFSSSINNINRASSSNQNINQTDEDINNSTFQKLLVIVNRCRGCGKCTRLDPEHFEIINGKSSVISTKNLDSQNLKLAIRNCPDQAIILE